MRLVKISLALLTIGLTTTFVTACKTRPLRLGTKTIAPKPDLSVADLSVHDLSHADLVELPDLLGDLFHEPDLLPPPDLTLPFICRNVYVIDSSGLLSAFDTATLSFEDLGFVKCPTKTPGATPYSMSIARDGSAYVLFSDDEIFNVNTQTAQCNSTVYVPDQNGFSKFGMGFSADTAGGSKETLYVADSTQLGRIEFPKLIPHHIGASMGQPELTGTADAELWGFFPATDQSFVAQIDKKTGKQLGSQFPLPSLTGNPQSWAFAFWGGSFWIFLSRQDIDASTGVYQLDRGTGKASTVLQNTGRQIVGAGVSSCAPLGLDMN